jgi:hypothetical protein
MLAGFTLGWAAWASTLALAPTWGEARAGTLLDFIWLAAILVSVLIFRSSFDLRQRATQLLVAVTGVLAALLLAALVLQG